MYKLVFLTCFIWLQACNEETGNRTILVSEKTLIDPVSSSCPYLTTNNQGNIVLSWIRKRDSFTNVFCYAVSGDGGETFGNTVEIPGSDNVLPNGENMPKIVYKPSGEIIAVWGTANPNPKNSYSGLVYFARSFDEGKTWTMRSRLVTDSASFDQRYFDVGLLPSGEAAIVWLDNRKRSHKEGSGLYYAVTNERSGFINEKLISEPCCQCCRTDFFVDAKNNFHVVYRAILEDSIRDMVHVVSGDYGKTFSKPVRISNDNWVINGCPHTGPAVAENNEGLHFAWFTGGDNPGIYYNNSSHDGSTYSKRDSVSSRSAKHCQIASLPNSDILIGWNETFPYKNDFSTRVGVEIRDKGGKPLFRRYITAENGTATFPVIKVVDNNTALVAYVESRDGEDHVMCMRISF